MKSLFIILTLVSISSAYYQQCTPGTYFKNDCNTCVCSYKSRPVCTKNVCQFGFYNPGSSSQNPLDYIPQIVPGVNQIEVIPSQQIGESHSAAYEVCTPNSFFYINCNRCWCSVFGDSYSCTQSTCGPTQPNQKLPDYPQYPQQNIPSYPQYPQQNVPSYPQYPQQNGPNYPQYPQQNVPNYPQYPQQNVPGYPQYPHENIPNYPSPNVPNKHLQTSPTFSSVDQIAQQQNPQPNTPIFPAPNVPNQQQPTQKVPEHHHKHSHGCGHSRKRVARHVTEKSGKVCKAGEKFKEYCNDCICSADGTNYTCTKKTCNPKVYKKDGSFLNPYTCEPNTTFRQYCNLCVCPEIGSGEIACTAKACKDDTWYKDGTLKNPKVAVYENGATCNAGQLFYSGCNQCICRDNGKSAYCTLKRCQI